MLSDGFQTIWIGREHFENNVFKACILMVFETIGNYRNVFENIVSKACIPTVFKRVGTAEIF